MNSNRPNWVNRTWRTWASQSAASKHHCDFIEYDLHDTHTVAHHCFLFREQEGRYWVVLWEVCVSLDGWGQEDDSVCPKSEVRGQGSASSQQIQGGWSQSCKTFLQGGTIRRTWRPPCLFGPPLKYSGLIAMKWKHKYRIKFSNYSPVCFGLHVNIITLVLKCFQ